MVHIGTAEIINRDWSAITFESQNIPRRYSVLIVRDRDKNTDYLDAVCEFLDIAVEHVTAGDDLRTMLPVLRPMAVIADLDGDVQDGFHVMKIASNYNHALPILLLTGNDPALLGAVDAVQEVWGLTRVTTAPSSAGIGALVDFICNSARDAGRSRSMRI
jgi:CheY-like chemotaxis protein